MKEKEALQLEVVDCWTGVHLLQALLQGQILLRESQKHSLWQQNFALVLQVPLCWSWPERWLQKVLLGSC